MSDHVYKSIDVTGSGESVDAAIRRAVSKAAETVRHISWFQVDEIRGHVEDDAVAHVQVTLRIGFRLE
jgi:flavin-binding protein dodecin